LKHFEEPPIGLLAIGLDEGKAFTGDRLLGSLAPYGCPLSLEKEQCRGTMVWEQCGHGTERLGRMGLTRILKQGGLWIDGTKGCPELPGMISLAAQWLAAVSMGTLGLRVCRRLLLYCDLLQTLRMALPRPRVRPKVVGGGLPAPGYSPGPLGAGSGCQSTLRPSLSRRIFGLTQSWQRTTIPLTVVLRLTPAGWEDPPYAVPPVPAHQ
jgi:hypothetical protein